MRGLGSLGGAGKFIGPGVARRAMLRSQSILRAATARENQRYYNNFIASQNRSRERQADLMVWDGPGARHALSYAVASSNRRNALAGDVLLLSGRRNLPLSVRGRMDIRRRLNSYGIHSRRRRHRRVIPYRSRPY